MKRLLLMVACIMPYCASIAQASTMEDSLNREYSKATKVEDRLRWMDALAKHYLGENREKSEYYGAQIIAVADSSRNRELMAKAYLYNADRCFTLVSEKVYANRGIEYANKALEMARSNNLPEYQAWAYAYLARGMRQSGEIDKAINNNIQAISIASNTRNDSLKVSVYLALGNTYMQKDEKLLAFRNILQALTIAEETNKYFFLQNCYGRMSSFYSAMEDYEKAKDYEFKREALHRANNKRFELLESYAAIGNIYLRSKQYDQAKKYYEKQIELADSLNFATYKLNAYLLIVSMYLNSEQYQKGLDYFNAHPELGAYMVKSGFGYLLDNAYGSMYTVTNALDSAAVHLQRAEPEFESKANWVNKFYFYLNYATYYKYRKDYDNSITYWLKAKYAGDQLGSLDIQQAVAKNLDSLYQFKGDYKNAHVYSTQYRVLKDSVEKLSRAKDLLGMEIENENQRKTREEARLEQEKLRRHNIQYMAIIIAIASIFIALVVAGVFSVSKAAIHVMGFFAFIFLFEFIILLADNQIHHWTHGEPWKVLAIKIVLIAMLLPLHHWMEKKVIHYLTSQHLLRAKGRGILGKLFGKKDTDHPLSNM